MVDRIVSVQRKKAWVFQGGVGSLLVLIAEGT